MISVGSHSTSGKEKEGKKEKGGILYEENLLLILYNYASRYLTGSSMQMVIMPQNNSTERLPRK